MSDIVNNLVERYKEDVLDDSNRPRSIGLFPIPEYPEFEQRGMWSTAVGVLYTTLRYLAPATLLTLFWGQQSFIFRLLKHIDSALRAIVFSSEEQKQAALQWISENGSARVEHLDTVWRHGWILCGILDASLPGACAGHPPTRLSLKHAQTIADHYLGVEPLFSSQELESNDSLSKHQEWKLATYLDRIRQALAKVTPPVSKSASQRTSPVTAQFTLDYIARGSGLLVAQVKNIMRFKIYPTSQQCLEPGEITVLIKGPKDTYGMCVIPPILGKAQQLRQKLLGLEAKPSFTENALPITQGVSYLRAFGKNNMTKTYHIPKVDYDIQIEFESLSDHVKVSYVVHLDGKYKISITSRGQNIVGSPFQITTSCNILKVLERDSFCLEDGEEIDIVDIKTDKKVVLRIVDFVTEKMLLKDNGTLERINDEDAKLLMNTDGEIDKFSFDQNESTVLHYDNVHEHRFKRIADKVVMLCKICKMFKNLALLKSESQKNYVRPKTPQDIPDVVNSTFSDANKNPFIVETRNKYIIPERLSVSIRSELKESPGIDNQLESTNIVTEILDSQALNLETLSERPMLHSPSHPFDNETFQSSFKNEKKFGTFVNSEYETNNFHIEEEPEPPVKIIVDENISPINGNPFAEDFDYYNIERPKTPILKIITGDVKNREDSLYVDPNIEKCLNDEKLGNEFINPIFIHHLTSDEEKPLVTDFIIGAPVSLPPIIRSATPEPALNSIKIAEKTEFRACTPETHTFDEISSSSSVFSTPVHTNIIKVNESNISSTFYSLESNIDANNDNHIDVYEDVPNLHILPRKDIWDSAYVSIDDISFSPDTNNNNDKTISSSESISKPHFSTNGILFGIAKEDLSKMGPAEKEIWQSCNDLKYPEELLFRSDIKRPVFTPIIEETDRSLSAGLNLKQAEVDSVTNSYSEINDVYQVSYPESESGSTNNLNEEFIINEIKRNENYVDSASVIHTDVKRQTKRNLEEAISEIQHVTELTSASPTLQTINNENLKIKSEKHFGDKDTNIVIERKKYWDERIQEIAAKSSEITIEQKRKLSSKNLRQNDSLTKRRGDKIAKTIKSNENESQIPAKLSTVVPTSTVQISAEPQNEEITEAKIVEKWKKYWDDKLDIEKDESDVGCFRSKSPKSKSASPSSLEFISDHSSQGDYKNKALSAGKQELPEEVYKAFETSPKRFFGTSRKQILNKIDTFLGKPTSENKPLKDVCDTNYETGLVSSRISLFHNISQSEDFCETRRKCQSMQNIFHRKDSKTLLIKQDTKIENTVNNEVMDKKTSDTSAHKHEAGEVCNLSFKDRKARLMKSKSFNKTFDDSRDIHIQETRRINNPIQKVVTELNNNSRPTKPTLKKTSISKSEMDIFNKHVHVPPEDYLDKYQSYDELPNVCVKNFISLYETVSKTSIDYSKLRTTSTSSYGSQKNLQSYSSVTGAVNQHDKDRNDSLDKSDEVDRDECSPFSSSGTCSRNEIIDLSSQHVEDDKHSYVSLSDMEIEIIDNSNSDPSTEPSPERELKPHVAYKSRFKKAKEFFQSLEEIRDIKKSKKLNECEQMLYKQSTESLETEQPEQRIKKHVKANSVPSSELAKVWNELQSNIQESSNKLMKISEKFQVEDLFNDVVEGKLSRQGSLRGIPNKKAVLETFKSMENLTNKNMSPYEIAITQLRDFAKEKAKGSSAQTYLNEYPYLPTTEPSKYQSRMDAKASGLITLKELLEHKKLRRNSVPDLRLNTKFTVEL